MFADPLFRLRSLFRRGKVEAELDDEVAFHLERETEKLIAGGVTPAEAARRARLAFGFPDQVKEDCRDARGTRALEQFARDLCFGARMLRRNPSFAAVAILSLALGIGANTAIFQLLDAVRLRSLPVRAPDELFVVDNGGQGWGSHTSRHSYVSYAEWEQIQSQQQAFASLSLWSPRRFNLANGGEIRPAEGLLVGGGFFDTLGVPPFRGRLLDTRDDRPGCESGAAVISYPFWQRAFGGEPGAIGRTLNVDGHPFTIAGITPPGFFGLEVGRSFDVAVPLCAEDRLAGRDSQLNARRDNYWLCPVGRLRPDWSAKRADAHLRAISERVFAAGVHPTDTTGRWLTLTAAGKGLSILRDNYATALWLLFASAALVLLIACGNLANLLLARASARGHEISVRLAVGASRGRLLRQLMTESLLIALAGAALGLLVAAIVSRWLVSFLVTNDDPVALNLGLDSRVFCFSLAAALLTTLLFGLAPALGAVRTPSSTRSVTAGPSLYRGVLVGVQVALSLVLVTGAVLFGRSLWNLLAGDPGFRTEHVLVTSVDTRRLGYTVDRQKLLFDELLARLRSTAGVSSAAQSTIIPMSGWETSMPVLRENGKRMTAMWSPVSPAYFATLGTPVLAGREFGPEDHEKAEPVAVINEAFARRFCPGENPVGHSFPCGDDRLCRIVGLVKNTKYKALQEQFRPIVFFPAAQIFYMSNYARYEVRSSRPLPDLTRALRESIAAVSPAIDIEFLRLDTQLKESVTRERLMAALAGGFGILAALLAAIGIYGVLSYSVATRRNEIGIRMAMGAAPGAVVRMVLREAALLLVVGLLCGAAIAIPASRAAASLLYGVKPNDPATLIGAVFALLAIGLASSYIPARRAATIDPMAALRRE